MTAIDVAAIAPAKPQRVGLDLTEAEEEGHYQVVTPEGAVKRHRRASDFTGLLDDNWALRRYEDRMLACGVARRRDLIALAKAHKPDGDDDDKKAYHEIILPQARSAAETDLKANIGTALHRNTVDVDKGASLVALDQEWRTHLEAYRDTMAKLPFRVVERFIEQTVILDGHRIAGTIDRVLEVTQACTVTFPNGRRLELQVGDLIVGDIKTGRWFTPLKWMIQCAVYAHHTATWHKDKNHPQGGTRGPAIGVRADVALVIHLQAGDPTAPCELHWLDLEAGYDAFLTALEISGHRSAAKKATALYTDHLPSALHAQGIAWARERLATVVAQPGGQEALAAAWPLGDGVAAEVPGDVSPELLVEVLEALRGVEEAVNVRRAPQPGTPAQVDLRTSVRDWLIERIRIVASTGEWALADLGARWPSTVPQPLPAELAQYQIEDLAVCLDRVEAAHQIPLGATRPGLETPTNNRRNGQTT